MEVQVQRSFTLFPTSAGEATPGEPYELPLTIFDRCTVDIHIAVVYAFSPPTPSNPALLNALSQTLCLFPTLTGELCHDSRGLPCFLVGGQGGGALVVEATVASTLSDHLPLEPSPELLKLHPPTAEPAHLLQVQLNRFRCGGLAVGLSCHHKVADGASMGAFLAAWGRAARGIPASAPPATLFDRSWIRPRSPPRCEFEHWGTDFIRLDDGRRQHYSSNNSVDPSRITNFLLHYSAYFISKKLKPATNFKYTIFETLLAHLWRKITAARGLAGDLETTVRVTVNVRQRMNPPAPANYFGNLVLNAYAKAKAATLAVAEDGLEAAARMVHEAIAKADGEYAQSMVDFGALHEAEGDSLVPVYGEEGNVLSPVVDAESWLRLRFEEMEVGGGGKLCGFLPTWVPLEGLLIFLPAMGEVTGGVDVMVSMLEEQSEAMKRMSHSLD
ncbi:tryptamine hydroxycinnamoyltransferase 1-like [Zingiber officinale]|uniref:Uncharacterized protein n=1 Tax=Zingiber officinale TaxID=94328 RepID=A0A8J5I0D7_ZINOF|nr:tryptamine hydroxycinnamoyltransferase 1-like [Zingiber officinale]KAG6539167.1 hypothetical protein ZIOFF_004320 [Zingiber officinale]